MQENNNLTVQLYKKIGEFHLSKDQKDLLFLFLDSIRGHDLETYFHCIRVGLKGAEASHAFNLNPKPLFYAGLLHDIGKISVEGEILRKVKGFSEEDFKKIKKHPWAGYFLLRKAYPFSAEILLRHHRYGQNPYPAKLPRTRYNRKLMEKYAQLPSLVDFHDALTSRNNEKFNINVNDKESVKKILVENHKEQEGLINKIFDNGIF